MNKKEKDARRSTGRSTLKYAWTISYKADQSNRPARMKERVELLGNLASVFFLLTFTGVLMNVHLAWALQICPSFPSDGACTHYVMVSTFQWKPFCLATERDPQNDWTAAQNRVNYDVFAQAPSLLGFCQGQCLQYPILRNGREVSSIPATGAKARFRRSTSRSTDEPLPARRGNSRLILVRPTCPSQRFFQRENNRLYRQLS